MLPQRAYRQSSAIVLIGCNTVRSCHSVLENRMTRPHSVTTNINVHRIMWLNMYIALEIFGKVPSFVVSWAANHSHPTTFDQRLPSSFGAGVTVATTAGRPKTARIHVRRRFNSNCWLIHDQGIHGKASKKRAIVQHLWTKGAKLHPLKLNCLPQTNSVGLSWRSAQKYSYLFRNNTRRQSSLATILMWWNNIRCSIL